MIFTFFHKKGYLFVFLFPLQNLNHLPSLPAFIPQHEFLHLFFLALVLVLVVALQWFANVDCLHREGVLCFMFVEFVN